MVQKNNTGPYYRLSASFMYGVLFTLSISKTSSFTTFVFNLCKGIIGKGTKSAHPILAGMATRPDFLASAALESRIIQMSGWDELQNAKDNGSNVNI